MAKQSTSSKPQINPPITFLMRAEGNHIPIHCAYTEIAPVVDVKPNPENANTHPEGQIKILSGLIERHGFRQAIVVSSLSGLVVKGHGRLLAAIALGLTHVPIDVQHYDSLAEEFSDLIADNSVAELSLWDEKLLMEQIDALQIEEIKVEDLGFTDDAIAEIEKSLDKANAAAEKASAQQVSVTAPAENVPATGTQSPKASDSGYAQFSLVMQNAKKERLVKSLDHLRALYKLDKLEDAAMKLLDLAEEAVTDKETATA